MSPHFRRHISDSEMFWGMLAVDVAINLSGKLPRNNSLNSDLKVFGKLHVVVVHKDVCNVALFVFGERRWPFCAVWLSNDFQQSVRTFGSIPDLGDRKPVRLIGFICPKPNEALRVPQNGSMSAFLTC